MGNTRIPLATVLTAFQQGLSPEEIVSEYPTLKVEDVYAIIAYYLRYRQQIDRYLEQIAHESEVFFAEYEKKYSIASLRQELLRRHSEKKGKT